jgi:hypothetical protein
LTITSTFSNLIIIIYFSPFFLFKFQHRGRDLTLNLPENYPFKLDAEIKLSLKNKKPCSISTDFPADIKRDSTGSRKKITASGVFNGGGSSVKLSTKNSDIYIIRF